MFRNLFERKEKENADYFKSTSINLFTADLLISSVLIVLSVFLLAVLNSPTNIKFHLLIFALFYGCCIWLRLKGYYESAVILYHISSFLLITFLIIIFGADYNFQLFYCSIALSIYLYAIQPRKYHSFLLIFYVGSFALVSLIPFDALVTPNTDLKKFLGINNLTVACISVTVKVLTYVNLKEKAVENFKNSLLKSQETERLLKDKEAIFDVLFNSPIFGAELKSINKETKEMLNYQANNALLQFFKMDFELLRRKSRIEFSPPYQSNNKKSEDFNKEIKVLLDSKNQINYQWDFYDAEGKIINAEITQLKLEQHNTIFDLALFKDITKQKKAEQALFENELMYRTLFENVYDGIKMDIYDKASNKKIDCIINKKMFSLFKVNKYHSKDYLKFVPNFQANGVSSNKLISKLRKYFEKNRFINFRIGLINGKQEHFTADLTAVEIEMKNTVKRILIIKDVTQLAKKEQIIQEQLKSLAEKHLELKKYIESNKQLELFAFKISHDLKNPIITIGKFAQLLKSINAQNPNSKSEEYLNFIATSADNLILLINDFLELSKISNQKFKISTINPKTAIKFVLNNLTPQIEACNATIKIGDLPKTIAVDEIKFFTLLQNLITNAINYRKPNLPPVIKISSVVYYNYIQFNISDNGIGIKVENQTEIFKIFTTVDKHPSATSAPKQQSGYGIGLSTCLNLVELHKGKIWVNSIYGQGSTFSFTISKKLNQTTNN